MTYVNSTKVTIKGWRVLNLLTKNKNITHLEKRKHQVWNEAYAHLSLNLATNSTGFWEQEKGSTNTDLLHICVPTMGTQ